MNSTSYISIYKPIAGYKPILMTKFDGDDYHDCEQTGLCGHKTVEGAIREAQCWSESTGIPYLPETHTGLGDRNGQQYLNDYNQHRKDLG
ncbi:MAG: hypothetical protein QM533_05040 [Cytophagales bacterium]|nr:hypothetical protein [Cytophagales bacterium]